MYLGEARPNESPNGLRGSAEVAMLLRHPKLPEATRALCESMDALYQHRPLLSLIGGERGRVALGWMTLYLDAERDSAIAGSGLTLNRFKSLCSSMDLCSPGRAAAMIGVMRFAGYLSPASDRTRGLPVQLIPTEKFLAEQRLRYERFFHALSLVAPEGEAGLRHMHEPDFPRRFVRAAGDWYLSGAQPVRHAPALMPFVRKKAGMHLLMRLMLSGAPDDAVPPEGAIVLSAAEFARRYGVSRAQVNDLLDQPTKDGLLQPVPSGPHTYRMSPGFRESCLRFSAAIFAMVIEGVQAAVKQA